MRDSVKAWFEDAAPSLPQDAIEQSTLQLFERLLTTGWRTDEASRALHRIYGDFLQELQSGAAPRSVSTLNYIIRGIGGSPEASHKIIDTLNEFESLPKAAPTGLQEPDFVLAFLRDYQEEGCKVDMHGDHDLQPWDVKRWDDRFSQYVNAAAFGARYEKYGKCRGYEQVPRTVPFEAFENGLEVHADTEEQRRGLWPFMAGAAQWIEINGPHYFALASASAGSAEAEPGRQYQPQLWHDNNKSTWHGSGGLSLARWKHWEHHAATIAGNSACPPELRDLAAKVESMLRNLGAESLKE